MESKAEQLQEQAKEAMGAAKENEQMLGVVWVSMRNDRKTQVETTYLKRPFRDMIDFLICVLHSTYFEFAQSVLIRIFPITFEHNFSDEFIAHLWKDPPIPSLFKTW